MIEEIDRISDTTTFNEIKLFDGKASFDGSSIDVTKPSTDGKFFQLFGSDISKTGYMEEKLTPDMVTNSTSNMLTGTPYVSVHINMGILQNLQDLIDTMFFANCCTDCCPTTVNFMDTVGIDQTFSCINIGLKKADGSYYSNAEEFREYITDSIDGNVSDHVQFAYNGSTLYLYDIDNNAWNQQEKEAAYFCDSAKIFGSMENAGKTLWIHSGVEPGEGIYLQIGNMSAQALGIQNVNVSSVSGADNAIDVTKDALRRVMVNRSRIGAQQNRLEHTIANEENIIENLTAAESRIRDADIAGEMVRFSNISILEQAGVSMLAQSNQLPNYILQLLQ